MQVFSHTWAKTHALSFFNEIKFHFIDSFYLLNNPFLGRGFFQHLYKMQDIANNISKLADPLVC